MSAAVAISPLPPFGPRANKSYRLEVSAFNRFIVGKYHGMQLAADLEPFVRHCGVFAVSFILASWRSENSGAGPPASAGRLRRPRER